MTLQELQRRYKNARARARYWSGTPSFLPNRATETRSYVLDEKYELAMDDCLNLGACLEKMTGKPCPPYNPKAEFAARFIPALGRVLAARKMVSLSEELKRP